MIGYLREIYLRQQFFPGILGVFLNPFYLSRRGLARAMAECAPRVCGSLLDVGCGTKPYQGLFKVESYVGLEVDSELSRKRGVADYFYDGVNFPFARASFDAVLCNEVLEHVFNPGEFIAEIVRVLRPNGKLLLTVPFVWDEHEQPYDYARYSSFGLRALLEKHGLRIAEQRKLAADASVLFQLTNAYLYKITASLPLLLRMATMVCVMAPVNTLGLLAAWVLPKNADLYLDNVILAEKSS